MSCRKPSKAVQLSLYRHTSELPESWDHALPEGHFLKSRSLAVYEQASLPDLGFIYVSVSRAGVIAALAAFQLLEVKRYHLEESSLKPWQRQLWQLAARLLRPRLLVAGHLFRHDIASFHDACSADRLEAFMHYRQALEAAMHLARADAVLVKDTPADFVPYFQHHAPEFLMLRHDISMEMELPGSWHSLKDYEQALKHKYAQRLRRVRLAGAALRYTELDAATLQAEQQTIYGLYRQVSDKQPARLGYLSPGFLPLLKMQYGDRLRVWGIYEAERMVAFASAWLGPQQLDMFYIGFDYERNQALQLYFNILFFSLEQALAHGCSRLILGRTALEAKARLGCQARYLHTFVLLRNRLLRGRLTRLQQRMQQSDTGWEQRHPLKA